MMPLSNEEQIDLARKAFYARFEAAAATLSPEQRKLADLGNFIEAADGSWRMFDALGHLIAEHRSVKSIQAEANAKAEAEEKAKAFAARSGRDPAVSRSELAQCLRATIKGVVTVLNEEKFGPLTTATLEIDDRIAALEQADRIDAEAFDELSKAMSRIEALETSSSVRKDFSEPREIRGIATALIDRDGHLVFTMTDGSTQNLGRVVGRDGLSAENRSLEYLDGSHEILERWSTGGVTKEIRYPAGGIHDRGYWREGMEVLACQAVTHAGSLWIALRTTKDKPSADSADWRIAARKGRDGAAANA